MAVENNKLLTDDVIAKEALMLLKNNLVAAKCVYRQYEKVFGKVGDTIRLELPYRVKSASGRVLVKQPLVDQTIPFKIEHQEHVGLEYTMKDLTLSIERFSEKYLKSGVIQIANKIDSTILLTLKNCFHTFGTAGTRPTKYIDYANAAAKQTTLGVPKDGMRKAILDPFTVAGLSDEVTKLFSNKVDKVYGAGYVGPVAGYDTFESQNLPKHTVGDYAGTPLVNGATAAGATTLVTDGWDAGVTGLLKQGDVFTIAGVYSVNPQNYTTTGMLQEFVVQSDVNSDGSGNATISFAPAMNDGTATTTNVEGDTISLKAYQNITALPADNAAIVVKGTAGSTYEQNYLFHKNAIALAMINLELPRSAVVKSRVSDPQSGLSMCLTGAYDITEQSEIHRLDAVWGTKLIYPELAIRLWGATA